MGAPLVDGPAPDNTANVGAAYVFVRSGSDWSEQGKLQAAEGEGLGVVSIDGDTVVVGASTDGDVGSAFVFSRSGTTWSEDGTLNSASAVAGERFGASVSLDGASVLIGAPAFSSGTSGAAYVMPLSDAQ